MDDEDRTMTDPEEMDYNFSILEVFNFVIDEESKYIIGRNSQDKEVCYLNPIPVYDSSRLEQMVKHIFSQVLYENRNTNNLIGLQRTIGVDFRLLDKTGIEALENLYNDGYIYGIRLLPEGTKLNQEIYDKLDKSNLDNNFILISDTIDVKSRFDTRVQNGIVKIEKTDVYDKLDEQFKSHNNIHINKELTDEELKNVVSILNEKNYDNIFFNFYDPSYYEETLKKLKEYGLNSNITITFLANPLYDVMELYSNLDQVIENPIRIHYNTCNDLNDFYRERNSELENYYSDIEASDICNLKEYKKLLKSILSINEHLDEKQYSDLEKIAYVYDYFKEHYIYDPDFKQTSHEENSSLHLISQKDRMICQGFSNFLSCILRRNGIFCFTVGVDDHQYNVVRVTDNKYGIDNLALMDITFDIGDDKRINNQFKNFLRPLDAKLYDISPSTLNLTSSLYISEEDYRKYCPISNPGYVRYPFGFTHRMFELMGLRVPKENPTNDEIRSAFLNSNLRDLIPKYKIVEAINRVRTEEGYQTEVDYPTLDDRIDRSYAPAIRTNIDKGEYEFIDCNLFNPDKNIIFDKTESQLHSFYPPNKKSKFETIEDYIKRIKNHFHNIFYLRSKSNIEQEQTTSNEDIHNYEQSSEIDSKPQYFEENDIVETVEQDEINLALQEYRNSGYGQNIYGHYYNVWIDDYDPDYKPWEDDIYIKKGKTK